ncbi:hypothetical protein B9T66_06710 [Helicobacter sp. TUL]|uniref:DUF3240 family protein n=1 Tax=Helicobacter sp. TUL TaxID=1848928 RepID=UPI000BAB36ED|nr:DUF3240 family protein [Helicobacter sp. TUL]PAU99615.1 hypothetical protein B9T66_06710 [Helicobacter sp. TUL]
MDEEIVLEIYFRFNLKDSIVDMLLDDGFDDFFYHRCSKYASSSMLHSSMEQVSGRQDYGMFKISLSEDSAKFLANKLLQAFGTDDIKIFKSDMQHYKI